MTMSNETRDMLYESMESIKARLSDIMTAINDGVPYEDEGDEYDAADYLSELPLEIVDERGREFAVVIGTGGPHIEIAADGLRKARLEGYWGGECVTLFGDVFDEVLDWFIDRD